MSLLVALALVATVLVPGQPSEAVVDPSEGVLDGTPDVLPGGLGDADLTNLQYGDPSENLAVIAPPAANDDGAARLQLPLVVPAGRAGVQPELVLQYDSQGASSWLGRGWDLSVGAIAVDTAFGAPRFSGQFETETYTLDGDRLFPNAIQTQAELATRPRVTDRSDFVRWVEGPFERIIRYGNSPSTYYWRVTDKDGTDRWYGGSPDGIDLGAILRTATGNGTRWGLSYVEDISGNTMRFTYDQLTSVPIGGTTAGSPGRAMYLRSIVYTGFDVPDGQTTAVDAPAYRVDFLRDGGGNRRDVVVDASGGVPVVERELLSKVDVIHTPTGASERRVGGYEFTYDLAAPLGKTLLTRIGQYGTDGAVFAEHVLDYADELAADGPNADGDADTNGLVGFSPPIRWDAGTSDPDPASISATSAISQSNRIGADGGAYIGFNPVAPQKTFSIGGSFTIAGGETVVQSQLLDIDGDGLPDKVSLNGSTPQWERNTSTPATERTDGDHFAPARPIQGIDALGRTRDFKVDLAIEAYPIASIQLAGGFGFDFVDEYFTDVNGDGRPDWIQASALGGTVYFNELVRNGDGSHDVQFVQGSRPTGVPLAEWTGALPVNDDVEQLLDEAQPRFDTVRRWVAPFDGDVRLTGTVALTRGADYLGDGAQVSIERFDEAGGGGRRVLLEELDAGRPSVAHDVTTTVAKGDQLFFRLNVVDDVVDDEVTWQPVVTYTGDPATTATDANGRSQLRYAISEDFTTFGRTGDRTAIADPGPATLTLDLSALGDLSDDVEVVVTHGSYVGETLTTTELTAAEVTAGTVPVAAGGGALALPAGAATPADTTTLTYGLVVTPAPPATDTTDAEQPDWVSVEVVTDSPVDPTAIAVGTDLTTTLPDGATEPTLPTVVVPNVRVFAVQDGTAPYVPFTPSEDDDVTLSVALRGPRLADPGTAEAARLRTPAVLTVKREVDGVVEVVARSRFDVTHAGPLLDFGLRGSTSVDFDATAGVPHWLEVSAHVPGIAELLTVTTEQVTPSDQDADPIAVDVRLHHPDVQGVFPSANRGWAAAGYNADHDEASGAGLLVPSAFDVEVAAPDGTTLDEDLDVDSAADDLDVSQIREDDQLDLGGSFPRSDLYLPWAGPDGGASDRWRSAGTSALYATATTMRSSRVGVGIEQLEGIDGTAPGAGRVAPRLTSSKGDVALALGLGPASLSGAFGAGSQITGFQDLNGDGIPDIRSGTTVDYTGPRGDLAVPGANVLSGQPGGLTTSVGGGLGASPVSAQWTSSSGGKTKGGGSVAPTSTSKKRGANIGLGFGIQGSWTNPVVSGGPSGDSYDAAVGELGGADVGVDVERAIADVNGDGLADIIETGSTSVFEVRLNTGYGFTEPVRWAAGTFERTRSVAGSLSVGFQIVNYEWGGGAGGAEAVALTDMEWVDLDGDGVLDRLTQQGANGPTVVFGTGNGMGAPELDYGTFGTGTVDFVGNDMNLGEAIGERASFGRSTSVTGGVDFSIYIGPICLVACYIIINPGVHAGGDRSTVEITLEDVNGDGHLDVVESKSSGQVQVRLNEAGRTNLLTSVRTPVGGEYRIDYDRLGSTLERPDSLWVMSSLEVDDGRPGDGEDVALYRFAYEGDRYDRALRERYGFTTVTEQQLAPVTADRPAELLRRSVVRRYANTSPFDAGVLVSEQLVEPGGTVREDGRQIIELRGVAGTGDLGALPPVGDPDRFELLDLAAAPLLVADEFDRVDGDGDVLSSRVTYTYDDLGNITSVVDRNSPGTPVDDVTTSYDYPTACGAERTRAAAERGTAPDTWVQVPSVVTVTDADGVVLRQRDGSLDLCLNAVPIRIVATQGTDVCGDTAYAVTELAFDDYGSYGSVLLPANTVRDRSTCGDPAPTPPSGDQTFFGCTTTSGTAQAVLDAADAAERPCVDYVYDPQRFTDIASVTDSFGVTTTASYDPLTGRLASEVDPSGNPTLYCYDAQGRLAAIVAPRELAAANVTAAAVATAAGARTACGSFTGAGSAASTVSYGYSLVPGSTRSSGGHAWSTASHRDAFSADRIETATFIDGIGRVVQRKRDADVDVPVSVVGGGTELADVPVRIVEGAVDFDELGREVREWYPVVELHAGVSLADAVDGTPVAGSSTGTSLTTYNSLTSSSVAPNQTFVPVTTPTLRQYDVFDRVTQVRLPDGAIARTSYDVRPGTLDGETVPVSAATTTDPLGAEVERVRDVRGATLEVVERGATRTRAVDDQLALGALPLPGAGDAEIVTPADDAGTPLPRRVVTTLYDWDGLVRLVGVTGVDGATTTHEYDLLDNRTSTTSPDAGTTRRRWTPLGELAAEIDQVRIDAMALDQVFVDRWTHYAYDRDRLVGIDYPDTPVSGRLVTPDVTYTFGGTNAAASNAVARVVQVVDGSMTRRYGYDVDGNVAVERATRAMDPFDKGDTDVQPTYATSYAYDSLGRMRTLTYPDGEVLTTHFDRGGAPARLTSSMPQPDVVLEDGTRVARADRAFTYVDAVDYDQFGEVAYLRTGTGVETRYERDPARRRITAIDSDALAAPQYDGSTSTARQLQRQRYSYDRVGNVLGSANTLYGADGATALADASAIPENGVPGPSQHAYAYDELYRLVEAVSTYVDRTETRGLTYEASYADNGTLTRKRQEATTVGTTGNSDGGSDGNGGSGNSKKNRDPDPDTGDTTPSQCGDNQGSGGGIDNQDPTLTYTLDTMVYDPVATHRLTQAGSRSYAHDANGSMLRWTQPCARTTEVQQHTWDADNRITSVAQGTLKNNGAIVENARTDYRYNAEGERVLERRPGETFFVNRYWRVENGNTQYASVFLGDTRIAMHRTDATVDLPGPVAPCDDPAGCTCDPAVYRCDEQDVAPGACDAIGVVRVVAGTCEPFHAEVVLFTHLDSVGSTRVVTDEVGDVFQYVDYTATGRPWVAGQSRVQDTPYMFAGAWTDNQFDLVNFGERWYDPREEQFLSVEPLLDEDPLAVVEDPSLLSAYTYAASNPLRFVDPDGRRAQEQVLWTPLTGFNAALTADQQETLRTVPAWTITPSSARREGREKPAGGGPFTNDVQTLQRLTDSRFAKAVDRLNKVTTFLSVERQADGTFKVKTFGGRVDDKLRGLRQRLRSRGDGGAGANPQNGVADAGAANASATGPPDGGGGGAAAPPPPPPPPPARPLPPRRPLAGSAAANGT